MTRPAMWKVLTLGGALTALVIAGAGPALADPGISAALKPAGVVTAGVNLDAPLSTLDDLDNEPRMNTGAINGKLQTRGSTQLQTAPNPKVGKQGVYGPFFSQNTGMRTGKGAGRGAGNGGGR